MFELNITYIGDTIELMRGMPASIANTCVTSVPYWGLRDYGIDGQHGLEETPELYIAKQVEVFREVRRLLKDDGTVWLNIGDSYAKNGVEGLKPKDLVGIPWMLAFALRADGWYLRDCIIWSKPNPMPESVIDRTTKAHEYIFLLSKRPRYYYDHEAIREPPAISSVKRWRQNVEAQEGSARVPGKTNGKMKAVGGPRRDKQRGHGQRHAGFNDRWDQMTTAEQMSFGANKRSVWTIPTKPFTEAHFATFPEELPYTCILAGCPEDGVVLDPYHGAGTTGLVAKKTGRNFIGCEINPAYVEISERRLRNELGLFR